MKDNKIFILIILTILSLSFVTYRQFRNFHKSLSEIKPPELEMPKIELLPTQEIESYKEFVAPDEKLKFKYPADWVETDQEVLEQLNQEMIESKKAKTLLLTQPLESEIILSFLMVQEFTLVKEPKEIIEEIKKDVKEAGGEVEFIKLNIENGTVEFEARYKQKADYNFYSRERIILTEQNSYLISIFSLEKDWSKIKEKANQIFDSIQFTP